MGPPLKPVERLAKEYEYDATDSLAGTGIDIRAEEQALADYYAGMFGHDARTGFPANAPGSKSTFYGAGLANKPAQATTAQNQEELVAQAAERAWMESAQRLAATRSNEIRDPFLLIAVLHSKAEKIAKEHGINLNLDLKNQNQPMGRMKLPVDFPQPKITISTMTGPDGALVNTTGSWIPQDAYLVDQLALLSIATKHRIREKLEDGLQVAVNRQKTSHGDVPAEWLDVAAPVATVDNSETPGWESAVSPGTNPRKRFFDASNGHSAAKVAQMISTNHLSSAMRDSGRADRQIEEARLRKRQKRLNPEPATSASRSGSVAPGTPGSMAPEPVEKAPSKKELKKSAAAARLTEASSTIAANQTLQHLMGGFGLGGRKKGKSYSWMTAGAASGASTPTRLNTQDLPSTPAVKTAENISLTQEGRNRLGTWREDGDRGKQIQLRDWVTVLEIDGLDAKAIQDALTKLDESSPAAK